jgi:hypothetical protein
MRPWFNPAKMSSAVRSARNLASDTLSKGSNAAKRRAPACRARSTASSACWNRICAERPRDGANV